MRWSQTDWRGLRERVATLCVVNSLKAIDTMVGSDCVLPSGLRTNTHRLVGTRMPDTST